MMKNKKLYVSFISSFTKFIASNFKPYTLMPQTINPCVYEPKKLMVTINLINLHWRIFYIHEMFVSRYWNKAWAMKRICLSTKHLPHNAHLLQKNVNKCDPRLVSRFEWHKHTYKMIVLKQTYFIIYIQNDCMKISLQTRIKGPPHWSYTPYHLNYPHYTLKQFKSL